MTTTEPFTEALAAFHETWRAAPFGEGRCPLCGARGPFCCEWFDSLFGMDRQALIAGGAQVLRAAVADRHRHRGYMADYATAWRLVAAEREGRGPVLASWF